VRKHLRALDGVRFDDSVFELLSTGRRLMLQLDGGRRRVAVSRAQAAGYLDRAEAFLAAVKAVCR